MIKAILFDVDGVLFDSFESNLDYYQKLMKLVGQRPPTRDEFVKTIHMTDLDTVKVITGLTDEAEIKKVWDFGTNSTFEVVPATLPKGAKETLVKLSEIYALGIVTSREKVYALEPPLNALKPYFKIAITYEDTENHKPHPDPLLLAAKQLGITPQECVYIGDTETDLAAAQAAGMKFIHFSADPHVDAQAGTLDFFELPKLIVALGK